MSHDRRFELAARAARHGGRHRLSRVRFRRGRRRGGRDRVQHRDHRLPGGADRPVVPRADRDDDGARDRQRRRQPGRLRVGRAPGAPASSCASCRRWCRTGAPRARCIRCSPTTASRASPASTPARSPVAIRLSGAQRAVITRAVDDAAGAVERARRHPSLEGRDLVREVTAARRLRMGRAGVGGPDGSGVGASGRAAARAFPRRRLRLRHQARHPAPAALVGLPGQRRARGDARARGAGA